MVGVILTVAEILNRIIEGYPTAEIGTDCPLVMIGNKVYLITNDEIITQDHCKD